MHRQVDLTEDREITVADVATLERHDRQRYWVVHFVADRACLRQYAVLAQGEHLTEDPPTVTMTLDQYDRYHELFGLPERGVSER